MGCILPLVSKRVEVSQSEDWSLRVQTALLRAGYSDVVSKVHIVVLVPLNTTTVLLCPNWLYSWDNKTICFRDLDPIRLQASYSTLHIRNYFCLMQRSVRMCALISSSNVIFGSRALILSRQEIWWDWRSADTSPPLIAKNKSLWLMFPRIKQQTRVSTSWTKSVQCLVDWYGICNIIQVYVKFVSSQNKTAEAIRYARRSCPSFIPSSRQVESPWNLRRPMNLSKESKLCN